MIRLQKPSFPPLKLKRGANPRRAARSTNALTLLVADDQGVLAAVNRDESLKAEGQTDHAKGDVKQAGEKVKRTPSRTEDHNGKGALSELGALFSCPLGFAYGDYRVRPQSHAKPLLMLCQGAYLDGMSENGIQGIFCAAYQRWQMGRQICL